MSRTLTANDLFGMMHSIYPDIEDGRDDRDTFEHPLTAVGVVLLSEALLETIDPSFLIASTHYSSRVHFSDHSQHAEQQALGLKVDTTRPIGCRPQA